MKYILISVCERDISTEQFESLKDAQAQMLQDLEIVGGVDEPAIGIEAPDYAIHEMDAWSNVDDDRKQDWLIIEVK